MWISSKREMYFHEYSHSKSFQDVPITIPVWSWPNSELLRSSCSWKLPSSLYNLVPDEWLLWLTQRWAITISIHWSLLLQLHMSSDPLCFPTSFANVGKPSSSIDDLRSSCCGAPSLCSPSAPVSWCQSSSKIQPCLPVSRSLHFWVFSCRLTWEYSIGSRLGFRISFLMLGSPPCSFSTLTELKGLLQSCGGFFLALNGLCITRFMGLEFAIAGFIAFGFAIGEPSLAVASCPLLWHGTLLPDRIRKKITEMAAREHREIHDVEQTKKMIPHHAWKSLWSACQRVGFWCQHIRFGFLVPSWFCRTPSQEQLRGFWTRVSLLDFVFWWSSWSQLRYLQRCTTETRLEKNVCLRVRSSHLAIRSTFRLLLSPSLFPDTRQVGALDLVFIARMGSCPATVSWSWSNWSYCAGCRTHHLNYHIPEVESR